jgi:hypothetical protein
MIQGMTMYMTQHRPMHGKWNNYLMIFNLCSVMFCLYHMICFTDFTSNEGAYEMGFSFLITIFTFVCVNMLVAIWELIRVLMLLGESWCGFMVKFLYPCLNYLLKKWYRFLNWL